MQSGEARDANGASKILAASGWSVLNVDMSKISFVATSAVEVVAGVFVLHAEIDRHYVREGALCLVYRLIGIVRDLNEMG